MTDLPDIIGISGYAGAGKSHLADLLARHHGYRLAHFADPLREMARRLNPIIWMQPGVEPIRWAEMERRHGYVGAKAHRVFGPEFRGVLQRLGTDAGRDVLGADVWVDALFDTVKPGERVAIGDVRFVNEVNAIVGRGGWHVRVARPGVGPVNGHESETALDGVEPDVRIANDRDPEWMLRQLTSAVAA